MPRGSSTMSLSFPPFTRAVKELLIANGVVFLLFWFLRAFSGPHCSAHGPTSISGWKAPPFCTARSGSW